MIVRTRGTRTYSIPTTCKYRTYVLRTTIRTEEMETLRTSRCRLESREIGYAWLQRRNMQWQRLQAQSEKALHSLAASKERRESHVPLFGGRWEADLKLWNDASGTSGLGVVGSITSRFCEGQAMPLARTRWCYRRSGGKWMPFAAAQDAALEETFKALLVSASTKAAVSYDGQLPQKVVSSVVHVKTVDETAFKVGVRITIATC